MQGTNDPEEASSCQEPRSQAASNKFGYQHTTQTKEGAVVLRNLRKVAAYHCQSIIFTTVTKSSEKVKDSAIEEAFYGDVGKIILGACQQLVNGDCPFF